jgi:hypothetical protein
MNVYLVLTNWNGLVHHALEYVDGKATRLAMVKGRARRFPVSDRVLANIGFDGVIQLYRDGLLK